MLPNLTTRLNLLIMALCLNVTQISFVTKDCMIHKTEALSVLCLSFGLQRVDNENTTLVSTERTDLKLLYLSFPMFDKALNHSGFV